MMLAKAMPVKTIGGFVPNTTEGKDSSTVRGFKEVKEQFPEAELTFDKFHIMKGVNEAVDKVRCAEQKEHPELARSFDFGLPT